MVTGDITKASAGAIVNAANSTLLGGGGVDGAIHRAGGPAILAACRELRKDRYPGGLPAGEAVETTGGTLPARYVIHTVGPVWHGGSSDEAEILRRCYESSLQAALRLGVESVAFPAISTGVYGYPKEQAALVAWSSVSAWLPSHAVPRVVSLVFFSEEDARTFLTAVGAER